MNISMDKKNYELGYLGKKVSYTNISGEEIEIFFDHYAIKKEDKVDGEVVGYVEIKYPIAGLNVTLELDLIQEYSEQEGFHDYTYKIPFVDERFGLTFVMFEVTGEDEYYPDEDYGTCQCGGKLMPMYEERPFLEMYCTGCNYNSTDVA